MNNPEFEIENGVLIRYSGKSKNIIIPDNVTSISYSAFFGCMNLKSITIPNSITIIGERAFFNCNINEIILSKELALLVELDPENYPGLLNHKEKFKII